MSKHIARPGGEAGPTSQQERGGMEVNGKTAFCQGKGGGEGGKRQIGGGRCMRRGYGLGPLLTMISIPLYDSTSRAVVWRTVD